MINKNQWMRLLTENRDLMDVFFDEGFDEAIYNSLSVRALLCGGPFNKEALRHGVRVASRISTKYPLLRMAAILHDLAVPAAANYNCKNHHKKGVLIAESYLYFSSGWSIREINYICSIIRVHNYNLFNQKDITKSQPLHQWRKAILDGTRYCRHFKYKDLLRFALADIVDPGKNSHSRRFIRFWAGKQILRYLSDAEKSGKMVFSARDLNMDTVNDIIIPYPEVPKKMISKIKEYLLNTLIVWEGYDSNEETNIRVNIAYYIRQKQAKYYKYDSKVVFYTQEEIENDCRFQ